MPETIAIQKTAEPEPVRFQVLFSLDDWLWPATALICAGLSILLTTTLDVTEDGFSIHGNPLAVGSLILVVVVAVMKFRWHRQARQKMRQVIDSHPQFIEFNDQGLRYGWENASTFSWLWDSVYSAKLRDDALVLRLGNHRLKLDLDHFGPEEIESLQILLQQRQLLP